MGQVFSAKKTQPKAAPTLRDFFMLLGEKDFDVNHWANKKGDTMPTACTNGEENELIDVLTAWIQAMNALRTGGDAWESDGRRDEADGAETVIGMRKGLALLAKNGFTVDALMNADGQTALHVCVEKGKLEMVEVLLLDMNVDANRKDKNGFTPLTYAAQLGLDAVASLLLKHGAKTHRGIFAIHAAALFRHVDVVTILLEAGVDVKEVDDKGLTPARNCVLIPKGIAGEMVSELDTKSKAEALSAILGAGADINELLDGETLLHTAAANDLPECIEVLVKRGMDPNIQVNDESMYSPLHIACYKGNLRSISTLYVLGANMEALDADGCSPMYNAITGGGHDLCVKAMLAFGASAATKESVTGLTPLHTASAAGQVNCAYYLIEGGASVNVLSNHGFSPLMLCMKPELLVPADIPIGYVADYGSKEKRAKVARLLIEMGAEVDSTVIKLAAEGGMADVIAESVKKLMDRSRMDGVTSVTVANTLLNQNEEVVYVKLVNRASGEVNVNRYKLNTQLVQRLTRAGGGGGGGGSGDNLSSGASSSAGAAPQSVLDALLDSSSPGFQEGIKDVVSTDGGGEKEVTIEYDGRDFTVEGFGVVAAFLTTGRVDHLLVNSAIAPDSGYVLDAGGKEEDIHSGGKRKRGSHGGSSDNGEMAASKRRCLFDDELADKALQAADYFFLDAMAQEVKRLMEIYGFECDKRTTS